MPSAIRDVIFWLFVTICVVCQFYIIRAVVRADVYGERTTSQPGGAADVAGAPAEAAPGRGLPTPSRPVEILWAVLPVLLMIAAFTGAWRIMHPGTP